MKRFIILWLVFSTLLFGVLHLAGNVWGEEQPVPCPEEYQDGLRP